MMYELNIADLNTRIGQPTLSFVGAFNRGAQYLEERQSVGEYAGRALVAYLAHTPEQKVFAASQYAQFAPDSLHSPRESAQQHSQAIAEYFLDIQAGTPEGASVIAAMVDTSGFLEQIGVQPFELVK